MAQAQTAYGRVGALITLSVLFFLTFVAVLAVIAVLQLQSEVTNSDLKPAPTIGTVRQGVESLKHYYAARDKAATDEEKTEADLKEADIASAKSDNELNDFDRAVQHTVITSRSDFNDPDLSAVSYPLTGDDKDRIYRVDEMIDDYLDKISNLNAAPNGRTLQDRLAVRKLVGEIRTKTEAELANYQAAMDRNQSTALADKSLTNDRNAYNAKLAALDKKLSDEGVSNPSFRDLCEEFLNYDKLFGDKAFAFVFTPQSDHVLLLAVIMGVLGSLIYISRGVVFDGAAPTIGEILFRACLGAAVALAIYLFAGAGMVALGQPAGKNPDSGMSPDLISFLGITAGYLSEHVTRWMAQVGQNFFKIDGDDKPRWAIQLQNLMTSLGVTATQAAPAVGVAPSDINEWATLKKPVPPECQGLLAAFLRVHPSLIYTDLAPP